MEANSLVVRRQTGNLAVSPANKFFTQKSISFNFGTVKLASDSGERDENTIESADETFRI